MDAFTRIAHNKCIMCEICLIPLIVGDWFEGLRVCIECKVGCEQIKCEHQTRRKNQVLATMFYPRIRRSTCEPGS